MRYIITVLLFCFTLQAQGYINWQPPVVKATKGDHSGHSGHGKRKAKQLQLNNYDPHSELEIFYIKPTLEKIELKLENSLVSLPRTGMENYHALVVNQTKDKSINSSVFYKYSRGRPSKVSPTKITQLQKSDLEIAPILLPREHDEYHGSKSYDFEVRFKGEKLPYNSVIFNTSNGTTKTIQADEGSEFSVTMPNDFKNVKTGKRKNRPAQFILKSSYVNEGITYTTTLAMPYYVSPTDYWQSVSGGAIVLIFGLIVGLYLFRNINKKKKKKGKV
ncbi:hypothetical protein N9A28_09800 [Sulfurimonas sp.]|nr:hypothetical protein [Sulfurimonas sp.]